MEDSKTSSRNKKTHAAAHPLQVLEDLVESLDEFIMSDEERRIVEVVASHTLPPTGSRVIAECATILLKCELLTERNCETLMRVVDRAASRREYAEYSIVEYPIPYAMRILYERGSCFGEDGRLAVRLLYNLVAAIDFSNAFSEIMFHKHSIAVRDTTLKYWDSFSSPDAQEALRSVPFPIRVAHFAQECLADAVISETRRVKLEQTVQIIDNNLTLGGKMPRGEIHGRSHNKLGSVICPSKFYARATPSLTIEHSARIEEPCLNKDDCDIRPEHPPSATRKDRRASEHQIANGFSRRNARSRSDMAGCSIVTYVEFLEYAKTECNSAAYSLIWISAVPALDIRRPISLKRSTDQKPRNDEILVDAANGTLEYYVLRRKKKNDDLIWESCGLMCLPVPAVVVAGLAQMLTGSMTKQALEASEKIATKFSRLNPGQTPTLRRLRASARVLFAPFGFNELQFGAISGRLPPSIRALSHYYHAAVDQLQQRFQSAYEQAKRDWKIELPKLTRPSRRPKGHRNHLFCLPAEPILTVKKVLRAISSEYERALEQVSAVRQIADAGRLVHAINRHSLAMYIFQELATGLRPTGAIAQFAVANCISGSLTADKGSKWFSERSFSPLPSFHAGLLRVAAQNEDALRHGLRCMGIRLVDQESRSQLACMSTLVDREYTLIRERLTGQLFRASLLTIPHIIDLNQQHNWLRKTAAQLISGLVPQWQADEFLGHRRCGRESTGSWSTSSISHFSKLADLLEVHLSPIVPQSLLRPVEL